MSTAVFTLDEAPVDFFFSPGKYNFLVLPGYQNSGEGHWQTIWESLYPENFKRVEQNNWDFPVKEDWVNTIDLYIRSANKPVIILAHSLGCVAFVQWVLSDDANKVAGALLVAPADADKSQNPAINSFAPVPVGKLSFPSIVIASTNDPYAETHRQAYYAACWGSKFISIGNKGHINAQSNMGNWEEGLLILFNELIRKLIEEKS